MNDGGNRKLTKKWEKLKKGKATPIINERKDLKDNA